MKLLLLVLSLSVASPLTAPRIQPAPTAFVVRTVGQGPPIILIPGLTSPGTVWDDAVASLRDRYSCHVLTIAGFAGVPPIADPSLARVRDDLIQYIHANRLEKPILIGHSVGGMVAYWTAAAVPDAIGGVVALDGAPYMPAIFDPSASPAKLKPQAENMREAIAASSPEEFARHSNAQVEKQITNPEVRARFAEVAAKSDPRTTAQFLYEILTTDLRAEMKSIKAPMLLLIGTAGIDPAARSAYLAGARTQLASVSSVRVQELPMARHFIHLDAPAEFAAALREFVAAVGR